MKTKAKITLFLFAALVLVYLTVILLHFIFDTPLVTALGVRYE